MKPQLHLCVLAGVFHQKREAHWPKRHGSSTWGPLSDCRDAEQGWEGQSGFASSERMSPESRTGPTSSWLHCRVFSLACCQQQPLLLSSTHACRRHRPPHCMGCHSRNLSILQKSAAAEYRTRTSWEASSGELYAICPASIPSCSLSLYAPWLWSNLSSEIPFMRSGTLTLFHLSQPQAKQSTASPCAESELAGSLCFWESKPPPHPFFPFSMLPLRSAVVLNLIYLSSPWGRAPSPGWAENCSCFTNGKTAIC